MYVYIIFYVYTYICIILYVYMYIYIIVWGSYTRDKWDYGIRTNGQWQKNKIPGSEFPPADKKRKAPASLQGLKYLRIIRNGGARLYRYKTA